MSVYNAIKYDPIERGSLVLISTFTSDGSDATADFTSGIDSTYKEYMFIFNNIHPETDGQMLTFQANAAGGSGFNETITSAAVKSEHYEADTSAGVSYDATNDVAQSTGYVPLMTGNQLGNANDESGSGVLHLFNPSSTTFVKHFISRISHVGYQNIQMDCHVAGYINTTSAIDEISFKMGSGEIQGGTIGLFGVK